MNQKRPIIRWQDERFEKLTSTLIRNFLERLANPTLGILLLAPFIVGQCQAAAFRDLGFESPVFVPVSSSYQGSMDPASALPGWTVFWGTNLAPFVLYDNEFLDSAGVSILDTNQPYGFQGLTQTIQGRFTVLLQGGFALGASYPARQSVLIAQTATIDSSFTTMLFDVGGGNFAVSVAGQTITPFSIASFPNYTRYAVDVSAFSGQTVEIRFTAFPFPPPGLAINNVYLDAISFSSSALSEPPSIVMQPASQSPNLGSTVDLAVSATGAPPPAYQWKFNGADIPAGGQTATLELTNIQDSQSGAYTVVVTNIHGAVTSSPAMLTVQDPFIVSQPHNQSPSAGQGAGFFVSAGGTPPLSFQWLENSAPLSDGGKISGSQTANLLINNVLGGDAGGYSVIVSNGHGSVTSLVATLTVRDPIISFQPTKTTVGVAGTAIFSVIAAGTPPFAYQWFDPGGRLADGGNISGSQSASLKIANVFASEADTYWVVVSNSYGNVTSQVVSATLNVPGYTVLETFSVAGGNPYSGNPNAHLVLAGSTLYGTAESAVYRINTDGTGFTTITSQIEGGNGGLVLSDGTLYGLTDSGYNEANPDYGKAYKVDTNGNGFAVLNTFNGGNDGALPSSGPVLSGTTLYGTTYTQGSLGYGTLFKVNTDGTGFSTLLAFTHTAGEPGGVMAISGNTLYGTLTYDSVNGIAGKVFKVSADGNDFTLLKEFAGTDGREPSGLLLAGATLYGTTYYGGTTTPGIGSGTVFKVNTNGTGFAVLKNFGGGSDGANPAGDLVLLGNTLYGYTSSGGYSNNGAIFKIDTDGNNYAVLKRFHGLDGSNPDAGLVASGTMLYGTTSQGGPNNNGVVFALSLQTPHHMSLSVIPGGYLVTFVGIPGQTYSVQRAPKVTGPWATIASTAPNLDGIGFFQDASLLPGAAFYRTSYP